MAVGTSASRRATQVANLADRDAAVDRARYAELDARDACGFRETDPDRLAARDAAHAESARVQRAWRHDLHAMIEAGEYGRSEIAYHRRRCGCARYDRPIKGAPLRG